MQLLGRIAEVENGPDEEFLQNLENGDTVCYESDLGTFAEVFHGKQNSESTTNNVCFWVITRLSYVRRGLYKKP